jgi:hypothetical protein
MPLIRRILLPPTLLIAACGGAEAHTFGTIYNLPIPFWMYAFAASATLALSFLMVGFFFTGQSAERSLRSVEIPDAVPRAGWSILRSLSVLLLALTILTGLFGAQHPYNNFSLTFFWIGFVLGFAYLTVFIGDVYAFINPWRVLCDWMDRLRPMAFDGRIRYPAWLAYYPALALYMGFIWLELFGHTTPRSLGLALLGGGIVRRRGMVPVRRVLRGLLPPPRQDLANRVRIATGARFGDHGARASAIRRIDRRIRRPSEHSAFRVVHAFVDGIRWCARNAALGAGILEVHLSRFGVGHRPTLSLFRWAVLRLAMAHAMALSLRLPGDLSFFYLDDEIGHRE